MRKRAILFALLVSAIPLVLAGCYNKAAPTPDQVREKTAETTAQVKDNAKAVVQGLREGLSRPSPDQPLDLNRASKPQLMTLPGIDDAAADRIIAGRPYSSEHQLLERRIISREEYNKIADSVTVKK
jgi:DNA uptake protein ComE-like DNA-binding protein